MNGQYKFFEPVRSCYGQRVVLSGVEQIQCPAFVKREFASDEDANTYAGFVFGPQAFARKDLGVGN